MFSSFIRLGAITRGEVANFFTFVCAMFAGIGRIAYSSRPAVSVAFFSTDLNRPSAAEPRQKLHRARRESSFHEGAAAGGGKVGATDARLIRGHLICLP